MSGNDIDNIEQRWGEAQSLLPNNETILDHAQEMSDAVRFPLPFGDVVRCKDPYACDPRILPFLAWERSVDLWKSRWPLSKKRYVTAQAFPMQRKKGTDVGIRMYVSVAGGKVLRIEAPPLMAFPGRDQTPEERKEWLAQFPQLRFYPFSAYGNSQLALFSTNQKVVALSGSDDYSAGLPGTPAGPVQTVEAFYPPPAHQCVPNIDMSRYLGNKTFLFQNGVETPVDFYPVQVQGAEGVFTEYLQVVLPGSAADYWFAGHFPRDASKQHKYLMADGEAGYFPVSLDLLAVRTITSLQNNPPIDSDPLVYSAATVTPGLEPISVTPEKVQRIAPTKVTEWYAGHGPLMPDQKPFIVNGHWGLFATDDRARYNIYSVLYLFNPRSPLDAPRKLPPNARLFSDHSYITFPAYQARVTVEIFDNLPKCDRNFYNGRDMYLTKIDMSLLWDQVTAVRAAKSARDQIWVNTKTYDIATPNVTLRCGQIKCGEVTPLLNV